MELGPNKFKFVVQAILGAVVTGPLSYLTGKIAESWGILDPAAAAIGGWLKINVSSEAAALGAAFLVFVVLYVIVLWRILHPQKIALEPTAPAAAHSDPAYENGQETQKLRRKAIADCRNMVAEWGGNHSHSDQREAIERNPSFQMMRRHLEPRFLEFLARRAGAFIDSNEPHRAMLMAALASQLDRLETEWDLS